jgi:hypothetical protein
MLGKTTANKTEKREKQLAIGNGGRYAAQLAISSEQLAMKRLMSLSSSVLFLLLDADSRLN